MKSVEAFLTTAVMLSVCLNRLYVLLEEVPGGYEKGDASEAAATWNSAD